MKEKMAKEPTKKTEAPKKGAKETKPGKPVKEKGAPAEAAALEGAPKAEAPKAEVVKKPKKSRREVPLGIAHIHATFNNTVITITDPAGNVVAWSSAGVRGFKGSRKGTPFAATQAAEDAARKAHDQGVRQVTALIRGPGAGRESALRALASAGLKITVIKDVTPIPHNGCRPPKRRRV